MFPTLSLCEYGSSLFVTRSKISMPELVLRVTGAETLGFGFDFWGKGSVLCICLELRSCFLNIGAADGGFGSAGIVC